MKNKRLVQSVLIQRPPVFLNLEASVDLAVNLIGQHARAGAQLIVFPESWLPGYPLWLDFAPNAGLWDYQPANALFRGLREQSPTLDDVRLKPLIDSAREHKVWVVLGVHEKSGGTLYNTLLTLGPEGIALAHRKLMPTYTEKLVWGRGDGSTLKVLDTPIGRLSGLICWEHWMPLARAALHHQDEHIHVAQWPMVKEMNLVASRHYAFEGQCFVLAVGTAMRKREVLEGARSDHQIDNEAIALLESMPGESDDWIHRGGSAVIKPDGNYLVDPQYESQEDIEATLDLTQIEEGHLRMDAAGHYARPDIFELQVNTREQRGVQFENS
jgi:predicted amidohydrolase